MQIGELAALAGITARTVRHYHRIGVLPSPRAATTATAATTRATRSNPVLLDATERFEALAGLEPDDPTVDAVARAVRGLGIGDYWREESR